MKKINLPFLALCAVLFSCNSKSGQEKAADTSAKLNYPFKPAYSINWQPGDEKNSLIVLNCLKKYVDGDVKGAGEAFADSVEFISDQLHFKGKKDSLIIILEEGRKEFVTLSKTFESWIPTYYPDKKEEWVSLWYVEKWTDKSGKADSLFFVDDVKLKNGKIVLYDEKSRRFPPVK